MMILELGEAALCNFFLYCFMVHNAKFTTFASTEGFKKRTLHIETHTNQTKIVRCLALHGCDAVRHPETTPRAMWDHQWCILRHDTPVVVPVTRLLFQGACSTPFHF